MKSSNHTEKCMGFQRKKLVSGIASVLLFASMSSFAEGEKFPVNIDAQPTEAALIKLASLAGVQIIFPPKIVADQLSPDISGEYTLEQALSQLLDGSNLTYVVGEDNMVEVKQKQPSDVLTREHEVEEMIITATKRETRLQDTAAAISLLDSDTIEKRGLNSMGDYLSTIPGVTIQDRGAGQNSITMRGLSVTPQKERTAVGVYFGETTVSGMASANNVVSSDLRLVDIERVEVLKGPQGTLYGADSMGGIVRIIPAEPNLEQFEGSVAVQYSNTGKRGGNNNQMQGVLNIPLIENQLALRAVAYRFENSGYIENIASSYTDTSHPSIDYGQKYGTILRDESDIGSDETSGFRLAALWQPTENLRINLGHTWQKIDQAGMPQTELTLPGSFQQVLAQPQPNLFDTQGNELEPNGMAEEVQITSLVLDYDLIWGNLHSASSWTDRDGKVFEDISYSFPLPFGESLVNEGSRFSQELRFSSRFQGPIQVLAGLYYEEWENNYHAGGHYIGDPVLAGMANADAGFDFWAGHENEPFYVFNDKTETVDQKAFFGELSYDITDQLTATVGGRHYVYEQSLYTLVSGFFYLSETPIVRDDVAGDYSGETWKANLSWKPNDDSLIYAQWAQGFRLGRAVAPKPEPSGCDVNGNGLYELRGGGEVPIINGVMDPDTTENFELGFKGAFADNRITLDVALYHIDWEGLPAAVTLAFGNCGTYYANAGQSTSEGVEVESRLSLTDALLFNLGASWNEATLSGESSLGKGGDDLAGSADFNFSAGLEYAFTLANYDAFARVDYAYVGEYAVILNQPESAPLPGGYSQLNLRAGLAMNKLSLDVFVNNLTNADDVTWVEQFTVAGVRPVGYRLRPRTVGLNLRYAF